MQRGHVAKPLHLADRKIADSDRADLSLPEQRVHRLGGFFDRHQWVGPVNLIDIDVVGSKPAQGIIDLLHDAGAAGVAKYSSTLPLEADLGGNKHARAQARLSDRLADDLLGAAESIDRGGVDDVDAVVQRGPDGRNRLSLVGSAPHPPADGPSADRD